MMILLNQFQEPVNWCLLIFIRLVSYFADSVYLVDLIHVELYVNQINETNKSIEYEL